MYPSTLKKFNIFQNNSTISQKTSEEQEASSKFYNIHEIKDIVRDYAYAISVFRNTDPSLADDNLQLLKKLYPSHTQLDTQPWDSSPVSNYSHSGSPMDFPVQIMLETYLDLRDVNAIYKSKPDISPSQLYLMDNANNEIHNVTSYKYHTSKKMRTEIVLERWIIEFKGITETAAGNASEDDAYHFNEFTRRLYDLSHNLPATSLQNHLAQMEDSLLKVKFRVLNPLERNSSKGRFSLSKSFNSSNTDGNNEHLKSECLDINTPSGCNISACVSYRKNCNFQLRRNNSDKNSITTNDDHLMFENEYFAPFRRLSQNSNESVFSSDHNQYGDEEQRASSPIPETPPPLTNNSTAKHTSTNKHNNSGAFEVKPSDSNVSLAALLNARRESFATENYHNANGSSISIKSIKNNNNNSTSSVFIASKRNSVKDSLLESRGRYGSSFTNLNSVISYTNKRNSGGNGNEFVGSSSSRSNSFTNTAVTNSGNLMMMDVDDYNARSFIDLLNSKHFRLKDSSTAASTNTNCNNNIGSGNSSSSGSSFYGSGCIAYEDMEDGLSRFQELRTANEKLLKEINFYNLRNDSANNITSNSSNEYVLENHRSPSVNITAAKRRPSTVGGGNLSGSNGNNNYRFTNGLRLHSFSNPSLDLSPPMVNNSGHVHNNAVPLRRESMRERPRYTDLRAVSSPSNIGNGNLSSGRMVMASVDLSPVYGLIEADGSKGDIGCSEKHDANVATAGRGSSSSIARRGGSIDGYFGQFEISSGDYIG